MATQRKQNPKHSPNVIWAPQPRQRAFMQRPEYEALYGGAAGGGKSDALLAEALRQVHIPHYRGLIVRRTFRQLSDLIDRSQELYMRVFPRARYNDQKHVWRFPSGAKIIFGGFQYEKNKIDFQGKHYDFVGVDELTHFTWKQYSYLMGRNRPGGPGTRVYIRATTNPGGIGHGWVKSRFITMAPPMTPVRDVYEVTRPDGTVEKIMRSRIFVPASVFDNEILLRNDPNYLGNLAMAPEAERNALLYGSWDSYDGQVFTQWRNDPAHYNDRLWTHVIAPFRIPRSWKILRGFDWGYRRPFSVGWYAVDPDGHIYRIAEYYGYSGTPNEGVRMDVVEVAANIRRIEQEDENLRDRTIHGIADPSIFIENGAGQSMADLMAQYPNHVYWDPGKNDRITGKMQLHYRLAFDADGHPMFQAFDTCKHFIRTIPDLVYDEKRVEDVDTAQEDHIYDECRYVLMTNPIARRESAAAVLMGDDPLDLRPKADKYRFYRV